MTVTAVRAELHPTAPRSRRAMVGAVAITALGCGLLAARPALVEVAPRPVATLAVLFVALLALGAFLTLPVRAPEPTERVGAWATTSVVLVGLLAFALGRWLIGGHPPAPATAFLIAANTLAAVAEEAWFRRWCFGLLAPAGTVMAIVGSTVLFAAVHVSIYGLWVLPLDVAAGLLLGWQRAATGSWAAPAITHVIANLLVVL
jgi:hypothetical protein